MLTRVEDTGHLLVELMVAAELHHLHSNIDRFTSSEMSGISLDSTLNNEYQTTFTQQQSNHLGVAIFITTLNAQEMAYIESRHP